MAAKQGNTSQKEMNKKSVKTNEQKESIKLKRNKGWKELKNTEVDSDLKTKSLTNTLLMSQ